MYVNAGGAKISRLHGPPLISRLCVGGSLKRRQRQPTRMHRRFNYHGVINVQSDPGGRVNTCIGEPVGNFEWRR